MICEKLKSGGDDRRRVFPSMQTMLCLATGTTGTRRTAASLHHVSPVREAGHCRRFGRQPDVVDYSQCVNKRALKYVHGKARSSRQSLLYRGLPTYFSLRFARFAATFGFGHKKGTSLPLFKVKRNGTDVLKYVCPRDVAHKWSGKRKHSADAGMDRVAQPLIISLHFVFRSPRKLSICVKIFVRCKAPDNFSISGTFLSNFPPHIIFQISIVSDRHSFMLGPLAA